MFSVHDFVVDLAALPDAVKLPPAIRDKVYFETGSAPRLHCRGVMSDSERTMLLGLSTDAADPQHAAYQAASRGSMPSRPHMCPTRRIRSSLRPTQHPCSTLRRHRAIASSMCSRSCRLTCGEPSASVSWSRRSARPCSSRLAPRTCCCGAWHRPLLLRSHAWPSCSIPCSSASNANVVPGTDAFPTQHQALLRLHKAALLVSRLGLTHRQIEWVFDFGAGCGLARPRDAADR